MFWIFVRIASEAILTNIQNMFFEEIRIKQDFSYISVCSLSILYDSKFILMAMSCRCNEGSLYNLLAEKINVLSGIIADVQMIWIFAVRI